MKTIEVVAAAIIQDGKVLAAQRGYGNYGTAGSPDAHAALQGFPELRESV